MEVNSRQLLTSAAVIRVFESIGLISKEMPSIKREAFQHSDNVWAGKIPVTNDNSFLLTVYVELENIKYAAMTMCSDDNKESFWYYVVCGDETCENVEMNKIIVTGEVNQINDGDKKQTYKVLSEISCYDLYDFLKGFEIVRTYMIEIEPIKVEDSIVKKVLEFSKTLAIEE